MFLSSFVKAVTFCIYVDDRQLEESRIRGLCSSNYFFPELEYLYKGILIHLQLSKLNKYENPKRREEFITSAEGLFDLSIQKLDYGFTRFPLCPGWSISEFYQRLWLFRGGEHVQNQNHLLYSGSACMPMNAS